jgi:hypothetical protein
MLAGIDLSCLTSLGGLDHLSLRQFPAQHAAAMQAVGACTKLVRLRLDSRQAMPGLREVQVRWLAGWRGWGWLALLGLLALLALAGAAGAGWLALLGKGGGGQEAADA